MSSQGGIEIFKPSEDRTINIKQFLYNQYVARLENIMFNNKPFNSDEMTEIYTYLLLNCKTPIYVVDRPSFRFETSREIRELVTRKCISKEEVLKEFDTYEEVYLWQIYKIRSEDENFLIRYYPLCKGDVK